MLKEGGYSEKVIKLYKNKINVGMIKDPDINLAHAGPCGDTMKIYPKISGEGVVEDAKFQCLGCLGAASSGSAITRIVKGRTLGGLPESKLDCPKLAVATLQRAIMKYEEHKRRPL